MEKDSLSRLEEEIGYHFKNKDILVLATIHSSYANENKGKNVQSNERLEFLGDSVLNMIISDYIYRKYPGLTEGELTKIRAAVVCEASLSRCAIKLKLGDFLKLGKGEELSGGRKRISILSDTFETVTAAIYLDGGIEEARRFVLDNLSAAVEKAFAGMLFTDFKTQLQEWVQKNSSSRICYEILEEKGPDHDKSFKAGVCIDDKIIGIGIGKSKKEAEQAAAQDALEKLGVIS